MKKSFLFLLLLFVTSCISVELSGYNSGYKKLSSEEKSKVTVLADDVAISSLTNSDTVYQITASQLNDFLKQEDSVMIYFWSPHCPGESCYPISTVQEFSNKKGYSLIVVCDYFDFEAMNAQKSSALAYPMLAINTAFYKTNRCWKYQQRFRADLFNTEVKELEHGKLYSRYLLFNRGALAKTFSDPMAK